jgi:hypothetical protein
VADLCRNATILGVQEYGKRSEGRIRRLGKDGPRLLDDERELSADGRVRTTINDPSLRISKQVGPGHFDPQTWQKIQRQMDERGSSQRGIPRAKDPARYPLACRLVDLTDGCGSLLYGRMTHNRSVYTCGRYMRTAGAECASNQVDAEAMLRFTLKTLKQFVECHGNRERLRQKLLQRALREASSSTVNPHQRELTNVLARLDDVRDAVQTVTKRMAREKDDARYEALAL